MRGRSQTAPTNTDGTVVHAVWADIIRPLYLGANNNLVMSADGDTFLSCKEKYACAGITD